jgi:lipid II:glycine glycyltransferase (peptidoglycan interpeptide bridge formation enzyme)
VPESATPARYIETESLLISQDFMKENNWQVEVDQASDSEWSHLIELFEDANLYQTAEYGAVCWGARNLSRIVLRRGGEVRAVAQLRIVRPTPLKFGIAYLRWGPLWERRGCPADAEVPERIALAVHEEYVTKRKLFLRIIPNAFAGTARGTAFQSAFSEFERQAVQPGNTYRTFVLDLAPPLEEIRSRLDKKWRNQLNRAEKNDLTVTAGDGVEEYRTFCQIYSDMRRRKSFDTTVDEGEFDQIQQTLPPSQRMRVLLCREKGRLVAGMVASAMGNSAIYLLGATSDVGLNAKGAYLLQWTLIGWLRERGVRWYDLGGIDPEANPGVYHFKKGLSGLDTSQIGSLTASGSAVSSWMVGAGSCVQRMLRGSSKPAISNLLKQPDARV